LGSAFGRALAIASDGETLLVGAPRDAALAFDSGAAHVFRWQPKGWTEVAKLLASNGGPMDHFGGAVDVSGDTALISASNQTEYPGRALVFRGMEGTDCNANGVPDSCDIFEGTSPDVNGNGIPDECENLADLNGDGVVNVLDLLSLLALWGPCADPCPPACPGDLNGDCTIDHLDLILLLNEWSVI
jgi:hypothetical protein